MSLIEELFKEHLETCKDDDDSSDEVIVNNTTSNALI